MPRCHKVEIIMASAKQCNSPRTFRAARQPRGHSRRNRRARYTDPDPTTTPHALCTTTTLRREGHANNTASQREVAPHQTQERQAPVTMHDEHTTCTPVMRKALTTPPDEGQRRGTSTYLCDDQNLLHTHSDAGDQPTTRGTEDRDRQGRCTTLPSGETRSRQQRRQPTGHARAYPTSRIGDTRDRYARGHNNQRRQPRDEAKARQQDRMTTARAVHKRGDATNPTDRPTDEPQVRQQRHKTDDQLRQTAHRRSPSSPTMPPNDWLRRASPLTP